MDDPKDIDLEIALDRFGETALRIKAERDELAQAGADFARLVMVENFSLSDIAVHRAYERLRVAIDTARA